MGPFCSEKTEPQADFPDTATNLPQRSPPTDKERTVRNQGAANDVPMTALLREAVQREVVLGEGRYMPR